MYGLWMEHAAREHREELLREARERRLARADKRARAGNEPLRRYLRRLLGLGGNRIRGVAAKDVALGARCPDGEVP
jgi:hypothetical protein